MPLGFWLIILFLITLVFSALLSALMPSIWLIPGLLFISIIIYGLWPGD